MAAAALGPEINREIMMTMGNTDDKVLRGVANERTNTLF
jgi:hypothetical protein